MKVTLTKVIEGNQLYLYSNGTLIFKKWFDHDYSQVFHEHEGMAQEVKDREKAKEDYKNNLNNNKTNGNIYKNNDISRQ